jgi:hypothetical protein
VAAEIHHVKPAISIDSTDGVGKSVYVDAIWDPNDWLAHTPLGDIGGDAGE